MSNNCQERSHSRQKLAKVEIWPVVCPKIFITNKCLKDKQMCICPRKTEALQVTLTNSTISNSNHILLAIRMLRTVAKTEIHSTLKWAVIIRRPSRNPSPNTSSSMMSRSSEWPMAMTKELTSWCAIFRISIQGKSFKVSSMRHLKAHMIVSICRSTVKANSIKAMASWISFIHSS